MSLTSYRAAPPRDQGHPICLTGIRRASHFKPLKGRHPAARNCRPFSMRFDNSIAAGWHTIFRRAGKPDPRQARMPAATIKKAVREDGLEFFPRLLFLGGLFCLDGRLFALDVGLAAFFVFGFVVLLPICCLYFVRGLRFGVWHYEFLRATIQSLFAAGGAGAAGGLRPFQAARTRARRLCACTSRAASACPASQDDFRAAGDAGDGDHRDRTDFD